jgi:hypothetical protein
MTSVADYIIVADGIFNTGVVEGFFQFTPPPKYDIGSRVVLSFMAGTLDIAQFPVSFAVQINSKTVLDYSVGQPLFPQVMQEVVEAGLIKPGINEIVFSSTPHMRFSDVVLLIGVLV